MITNYQLAFIGYYLVPFIAVGIDVKRGKKERRFSFDTLLLYVSYVTATALITYAIRFILSRLGIGLVTEPGTDIYTFIACAVTLILPYFKEILVTYCNVRCEIKGKKPGEDRTSDEK